MTRAQRIVFPILAISISLVFGIILGEVVIRLFVPSSYWTFADATKEWRSDPQLGWSQKPNLDSTVYEGEFHWNAPFRTNSDGLQPYTAQRAKTPGLLRIMIFGDSTAVGRRVPEEDRIHVKLQKMLEAKGVHAEVINAGVQGYSTDQELVYMQRLAPLYRPDVAVLAVCDNDFGANLERTAYGIAKPMFRVENGRIAGLVPPDPKNIGIKKPQTFSIATALQHSALYRLFQPQLFVLRSKLPFLRENLNLGLPVSFYYEPQSTRGAEFPVFEALIKEADKTVRAAGGTFWFYSHPHLAEVWDPYIESIEKKFSIQPAAYDRHALDSRLKDIAARNHLNFCPVIDYLIRNQARGPFHLLPRDQHCNPQGYQLQAEVLSGCLSRQLGGGVVSAASIQH